MSPLLHYAATPTALTALKGLQPLVPERGLERATTSQVLHITDIRTCATVRNSSGFMQGIPADHTVTLRRLERGYYYRLEEALPALVSLNRVLPAGGGISPHRLDGTNPFEIVAPQLGTAKTDPYEQARVLAPFVNISSDVAATSVLLMANALELATTQAAKLDTRIFDSISPEMEAIFVNLQLKMAEANRSGQMNFSLAEAVQVLGLLAAIDTPSPAIPDVMFRKVSTLEMSVRSACCLQNVNIKYIGQLVQMTEADLLKTRNFGRKNLKEIKEILAEMGLTLGMKVPGWTIDGPPPPKPGVVTAVTTGDAQIVEPPAALWKSVDEMELSARTWACLQNANIKYIGQLVLRTEVDMLRTKNFGRRSLKEIKEILAERGLELGMKPEGWTIDGPPPPRPIGV